MPVLKRTSFTSKRNAKASVKYLFYGHHRRINQPKNPNESGARNLVVDGYGLNPSSYLSAYQSMEYYFNHNRGKRGLLNLVMSFPRIDFPKHSFDRVDSYWALVVDDLAKRFATRAFGRDHQFIDCVQDDGVNHNVHSHIFVNLVSTMAKTKSGSFRSMSGRFYNSCRLSKIASAVTNKFNREHGTNLTVYPVNRKLTRSQSHVYKAIHHVVNDTSIATISDFKRELNHYGVRSDFNRKHGKVVGLSFDYFPSGIVLSGYSNHVKASTLAKKASDPGLQFDNLLRRFSVDPSNLFNYRKRHLEQRFAKLLNSSPTNVKQLEQVVTLSPDDEQKRQANRKIKAVRLRHVIGKSDKSDNQGQHTNSSVWLHHPQGPSL